MYFENGIDNGNIINLDFVVHTKVTDNYEIIFYTTIGEVKWRYENEDTMMADFNRLSKCLNSMNMLSNDYDN